MAILRSSNERAGNGLAYLSSTQKLKESLLRNSEDTRFETEVNGEIVYIFDANVFIFHAYVNDSIYLTGHLNSLVGNSDPALSKTLDRLTAEFMFSGGLPGQRDCSYVTVPHLEEILDKADRIARDLERVVSGRLQRRAGESHELQAQMARILDSHHDAETKLAELANIVPKAWLSALDAGGHFQRVVESAFHSDEEGLVPLDRRDWGQTAGQKLLASELSAWRKVLPRPSATKTVKAISDDAESLQTVVNLYLQSTPPAGENRKRLFMLVTADDGVARAVRRRMAYLDSLGIPYFIRSPQDYLPLLNLNSMTKALDTVPADDKLRKAFGRVFETLREALDWAETEPGDGLSALDNDNSTATASLASLREAWSEFSKYVAVLSLRLSNQRAGMVFDQLAKFVSTKSSAQSAAKVAQISVADVRNRHIEIVVQNALARLKRVRHDGVASEPRRVNIFMIGDLFGHLLSGAADISSFLDNAIRDEALPPDTISLIRNDPSRPEVQLLAACLFVAAERWTTDTTFAHRTYANLLSARNPNLATVCEARYLIALCTRFSMTTRAQYESAKKFLTANITSYSAQRPSTNNYLRRVRDEIELGTLMMTAAVTQQIGRHMRRRSNGSLHNDFAFIDDENAGLEFQNGAIRLGRARADLLDGMDEIDPSRNVGQIYRGLKVMSGANLVGAYVFERLVPGIQLGNPVIDNDITDILGDLEEEMRRLTRERQPARRTQVVYFHAAHALLFRDPAKRLRAFNTIAGAIKGFADRAETAPVMDQLEFEWILNWVSAEAAVAQA